MRYKMVVLDLDGTLLNNCKELSPMGLKVLRLLKNRGVELVIATGRRYSFAKAILGGVGFPFTMLCSSGNIARNTADDRKIIVKCLEDSLFYEIVRIGRKYSLTPLLHVDRFEDGYDYMLEYEKDDPRYHGYLDATIEGYKVAGSFLECENPRVLLMCYMGRENVLSEFGSVLKSRLGDRFYSHTITSLTRTGPLLEIMSYSGNKWGTLLEYAGLLDIRPAEIIAIGNDNNDIEMIRNSGLGIAMKNANDQVKACARAVTKYTNNEDGVARVLSEIFDLPI